MDIIKYEGNPEDIQWPEGFREKLEGKTIQEQLEYYRVTYFSKYSRSSYGEITHEDVRKYMYRLEDRKEVLALVEMDGLVVGARIQGYWSSQICLPYKGVVTYYASDNEGSGYKEREDVMYLIPVPAPEESGQ